MRLDQAVCDIPRYRTYTSGIELRRQEIVINRLVARVTLRREVDVHLLLAEHNQRRNGINRRQLPPAGSFSSRQTSPAL